MVFERFIALGDSYTEGMSDEKKYGNYRGWADRTADVMTLSYPDFTYANLAVRGKLVRQVVDEQIEPAIAQVTGPQTLISFHAGANDVIRPNYRALWETRFREFNRNVRAVGKEVGAIIADANEEPAFSDRRFLAFDRLHLNAMGHDRVAQAVLELIGLPFNPDWREPLPHVKEKHIAFRTIVTSLWFITFALPWLWRRARGKSSGDGRSCKYPIAIHWPLTHLD
ncbi:MAG: SGNH/GDSL hydrolase family protein [Actinobacteria bacterium]|nr:SGNH/GDSL hydrolase family protein [Actinomycetota bacterium]